MSEGELKKRIIDIPSFHGKKLLAVIKIVGEAAKEFPNISDPNLSDIDARVACCKWFIKWFGDAPP